jgi:tetratricopeptide (TPR) repeat protein
MPLVLRNPLITTTGAIFVAVLVVLALVNRSPAPTSSTVEPRAGVGGVAAGTSTEARIDGLEAVIEDGGASGQTLATLHTELGLAYLTRAGELADSRLYLRSDAQLDAALRIDPRSFAANSASGKLALARHDFRAALAFGERARAVNSSTASNYEVLTDAHIELGQYGAAERTLRRWVNLKPGLAPYARVSYFRELHGDIEGAIAAMRMAAASAGAADFTYLHSLVGKLEFDRGRYAAARRAYTEVLAVDPAYPAALAGLGSVAAARGNFDTALRQYQAAAQAQPVADYPLAIGELQELAGHEQAAERAYARTAFLIKRERPNGVDVRVELALFEAEHGDPMRAVALARASLPDRPSVVGYDALAWSLHHAGMHGQALEASREAMKLGSRDPLFLYRAGMISAAAGAESRAQRLLGTLLEQSPRFHPLYAPRARAALAKLSSG